MNSFQFSIRIYIKDTRIAPFIMPRNGLYTCHWGEAGICHFEGIENGFLELKSALENHFHFNEPTEEGSVIEYYDRLADTLLGIGSQLDFETALMHSSQTYSPFSILIKVNAKQRDEHFTNGFNFSKTWRISKPKFTCIRKWLVDLNERGETLENISDSCSYGERAILFSQFQGKVTNENKLFTRIDQSKQPQITSAPLKDSRPFQLELLDGDNKAQQMLNEKMMMDPAISLILFNEYIPLKQPNYKRQQDEEETFKTDDVTEKMEGLFLGKRSEIDLRLVEKDSKATGGLFIRSEESVQSAKPGGLFIRSSEESDDWVIA